jgi:hypothetical protein
LGIRDFIQYLQEHREKLQRAEDLAEPVREETLKEAETMVGMAEAAVKDLESVLNNRRVNLNEEHALRFAQDVFTHLKEEEERVKETLQSTRDG